MRRSYYLLAFFLFININCFSQENNSESFFPESSFELRGYLSNMQSVMISDINEQWINDNLFHNRLNFFWYPGNFTASVQLRNRFMYGQTIYMSPGYTDRIDYEDNFLDLSYNIFSGKSYFLNSNIDRLYIQYTAGKFVLTGGRQRINWGQTMVWNPNDVFNVQNYFDFDYPEKPGSDAIRIQFYPAYTSSIELAAKLDSNNKLTAAGYYMFNKWGYDLQFLAGLLSETDIFAGLGWAGDIEGAGFRGELSYFQPKENFKDTSGILISSVSLDYTFSNSFYLQFESLYSEKPEGNGISNFYEYYQGNLDVKSMSFSEWNLFIQASYPFTPLLNGSISFMYFPDLAGFYTGPSISYSLTNNSVLRLISQIFNGEFMNPFNPGSTGEKRTTIFFGFVRYKFNF
ncbi:MAG: hypothetical protein ACOCWA_05620 [Bacteroidota bacterium]